MEIKVLRPGDDRLVAAASHLFDGPATPEATARFLGEPGHHLFIAYVDERPSRATYEGTGSVPQTDQVVEVWTF